MKRTPERIQNCRELVAIATAAVSIAQRLQLGIGELNLHLALRELLALRDELDAAQGAIR